MSGEHGRRRLLVIEDDTQLRKFLRISLGASGFAVDEAGSGGEGLTKLGSGDYDLIILDLGLPDVDGQELIGAVRSVRHTPIIVLSARAAEEQKVRALDGGAADYVSKPFGIAELTARIRAVLRARRENPGVPPQLEAGSLRLDHLRHEVSLAGRPLKLTPKEFALLALLMSHPGRVLTHRHLLNEVWGERHSEDTHYLRVYIGQLRQKLGDDPAAPRFIANEPGIGYRFVAAEPPP